ncbi:MAG: zinc-ribbon domain-containing protein [Pyrinomonadaceae bacterium]
MILRCDNCSVSLQLDESKIPGKAFTVKCPRCQNLIQVRIGEHGASTVDQLKEGSAAEAVSQGDFVQRESDVQINSALRALLGALQEQGKVLDISDEERVKPRRALVCAGANRERIAKSLVKAGYKVYLAQTPAQANERLRDGKTEVLLYTPDFAADFGGAAILQQKLNGMSASERRRLFLASIEEGGTTMNAHEAFLRNLNLIVNTADIEQLPLILDRALTDFNNLYFYYNRAAGATEI